MTLAPSIEAAVSSGRLMPSAAANLGAFLGARLPDWAQSSLQELVEAGEWAELNDRFYRDLEFGTGGMRGRTVGTRPTASERGGASVEGPPSHAAIGSNMLNDVTLTRAGMGL